MTYQIIHTTKNGKQHVMFDIEYYLTCPENDHEKWHSELHCLPIVDGIANFLKDSLQDNGFKFDDFINDARGIQEIRGLLYEQYSNRPIQKDSASQFHYHVFGPRLEEEINSFVNKYGLDINKD